MAPEDTDLNLTEDNEFDGLGEMREIYYDAEATRRSREWSRDFAVSELGFTEEEAERIWPDEVY